MAHMLPFSALVGIEPAQQALLLLAVEPRLRGVAIAAGVGAGKSSLARGYAGLLADGDLPRAPFVELPVGADDEALLGGLDLEATLRLGRRVARPGLLARADGGIVYVDGLNLLTDSAANLLLTSLENREVRVEREGLSLRAPARFALIGSYDPSEGQPRRHLLDRVGLLVTLPRAADLLQRAEVVRRNWGRPANERAPGAWEDALDFLRATVAAARALLPDVRITESQVEQLVAAAEAFGVEGHRADSFAVLVACASAALALRDDVDQDDLELAVRLVILPRATRIPERPPEQPPEQPPPPPDQPQAEETPPDPQDQDNESPPEQQPQGMPEEQVLTALATELPPELDQLPFRAVRRGRSGSRGSTNGKRGRHIRSLPGDPRRARLDIPATLRAAAPWQLLRQSPQRVDVRPVMLRAEDLRVKQYKSKAGALFLFAVDASGSMALHRMRQAKGAVHALLQRAYVQRDRVALLAFRGQSAELLLPPSQSVELARRALDTLPTGGGTPLGAALLAAIEVAGQARSRGILQTVLVLLTDGRANIGVRAARPDLQAELQALGRSVAAAGIRSIVVDTQRSYLSRGEARSLAAWLGGEYVYLPNANGDQIAEAAMAARDDYAAD
jgi:magnesium chelatase subunit D